MSNKEILQSNLKKLNEATKGVKSFISSLLDKNSFVETDVFTSGKSFLDGSDALGEGVVCGYGTIDGNPVQIFAQNPEVMKGSISKAHAEKIEKCFDRAIATGTPIISIVNSAGARVGEGVSMLEGYASIVAKAVDAKNAIPHICIINGTSVGLMSSFASLADFVFMSNKSIVSTAAPLLLCATCKDNTAADTLVGFKQHSVANNIASFGYADEKDLNGKLKSVLALVTESDDISADDPNRETAALNKSVSVDNILKAVCDDGKFVEYCAEFASDVKCVFTKINGITSAIIINNISGSTVNGAMLDKMTAFVNKANALGFAIINFVDCSGVVADINEELNGLSAKAAAFMEAIATASVEKIAVITGKAIGFAYSAFASKAIGFDYTLAFADAQISAVNADAAINVLYYDEIVKLGNSEEVRAKLYEKYAAEIANPFVAAKDGFVDNIILPSVVRPYIASALMMLLGA